MSLSDLASLGSFVSGFAVLVSLVYLALQTRQNVRPTRALIRQGWASRISARVDGLAGNAAVADIIVRGNAADATLADADISRFMIWTLGTLTNFENQFEQHEDKLYDDTAHEGLVKAATAASGS